MKTPTSVEKKLNASELLTLAVITVREALQGQVRALRANPATLRFADEIQRSVETLDLATAALAAQVGWPTFPGAGGSVPPEVASKSAAWIARGKKDPL
jgi:hypothetical protein